MTRSTNAMPTGSGTPLAPIPATETELLGELRLALDAADEALVIVVRRSREVLWCTDACRRFDAGYGVGSDATALAGIETALDRIEQGNAAPRAIETPLHRLECLRVSERYVTFRIGREQPSENYLHRYVADREKLFSVSRSVSVSEMATTLAHELNQPIGTIANLLQGMHVLIARQGEVPEPLAQALARASDQTRFAAGIISRIRSFTRSRAPQLVPCEVDALLARTMELLDWVFRSERVDVQFRRGAGRLTVAGDEILLQQVFANLLRNAVDAMRERPAATRQIRVRVEQREEKVAIEVRDSGEGLPADAVESLFVPFLTHKSDGMGVGLNICRSFVEMHRGRLWLADAADGGCTAHVQLPLHRGGENL